jgi:signal transduction histidine kinase
MTSVTKSSIEEYIHTQHNEIANHAGNEIILFLKTPIAALNILLETQDIKNMVSYSQSLILNRVKYRNPMFNRIFTLDTAGTEFASSAFEKNLIDYKSQEFFKKSIAGESDFSQVNFNDKQEPYVISSHPIRQFGEIVGVLAGEIDLKSIWDLLDSIKIGQSGNAFVIGGNGQLIAYPDKKKILDKAQVIDLDIIQRAKEDSVIKTLNFYSPDDVEMLGTFAYLSEFDWVIIIQQPVEEAYSVSNRMLYQVFAFVGLVIMLAVLLAYLLERRITAPITTLVDGVKRYADGQLNFRIRVEKYEEISALAEEFNSMAEKLLENQRKLRKVERLAAMSKFATLVSHEIRNPLNSMNINMQILKREMENPRGDMERKRKYFDIIFSEIQRMDNLVNNFLMISRPPRFDFLLNDIHEILEEVVLMHSGNAEQQNVQINRRYSGKKILANVDRDQLKQVFHNIIINALQAMPKGGVLTIRTHLRKMTNRLRQRITAINIEFNDTGEGIAKDKMNDIFELYYTSKKTGTGLGLAIARQIVEGHLGSIHVKSKIGEGTRMIINIPVKSNAMAIKDRKKVKLG